MNVVCFGHTSWNAFPYKNLLNLLPDDCALFYISDKSDDYNGRLPVQFLSLADLSSLEPDSTVALVTHPCWIQIVQRFKPGKTVLIIPDFSDRPSSLYTKYLEQFCAKATIVFAESEKLYLEQCFRRDAVFWLNGDNVSLADIDVNNEDARYLSECEVVFRDAVKGMTENSSLQTYVYRQWLQRAQYYREFINQHGHHPTASFLLAVYLYLLEESEARTCLLQSFEQNVLSGNTQSLQTHYRFLSAIEAKAGNLPQAVATYGITAVLPEERKVYLSLLHLLQQGEEQRVQAELFYLNDDFRSARAILAGLSSHEAGRRLFQLYLQTGNMEEALKVVKPGELVTVNDQRDYALLRGTVEGMNGRRHEAIRFFLKAATYDYDAIHHILEMKSLDRTAAALLRGADPDGDEGTDTSADYTGS